MHIENWIHNEQNTFKTNSFVRNDGSSFRCFDLAHDKSDTAIIRNENVIHLILLSQIAYLSVINHFLWHSSKHGIRTHFVQNISNVINQSINYEAKITIWKKQQHFLNKYLKKNDNSRQK